MEIKRQNNGVYLTAVLKNRFAEIHEVSVAICEVAEHADKHQIPESRRCARIKAAR